MRSDCPVVTLNDAGMEEGLDLTIDGADEVDGHGNLIKGGGGALLMEKVVAYASRRFVVVVDRGKISDRLGAKFAVPIEVVPGALAPVRGPSWPSAPRSRCGWPCARRGPW